MPLPCPCHQPVTCRGSPRERSDKNGRGTQGHGRLCVYRESAVSCKLNVRLIQTARLNRSPIVCDGIGDRQGSATRTSIHLCAPDTQLQVKL
ncbi:hypothetical protein J6590_073499 [Homalodisca vitripennis]|nr:hypothetical protein J6590_073499 [Homalodisca vitripennis]